MFQNLTVNLTLHDNEFKAPLLDFTPQQIAGVLAKMPVAATNELVEILFDKLSDIQSQLDNPDFIDAHTSSETVYGDNLSAGGIDEVDVDDEYSELQNQAEKIQEILRVL